MKAVRGWLCGILASCAVLAAPLPAACADAASPAPADASADRGLSAHESEIREWRRARHARLSSDQGWLTLVGLEWLREGDNLIGSGDANDIRVPGGPARWGNLVWRGDDVLFEPAAEAELTIDGKPAGRTRLVADSEGEPTVVRHGNLSFYVIMRGSLALRIKDTRAPTLLAFAGVENYPIDPGWRYEARFIPAESGQTIEIANVLGQMEAMEVIGHAEFERDGRTHRLLGVREKGVEALWFLFADRTNGRETYGAGRFLYSDGMPENGRVLVDFNKSYNPPCAFNDYSTCPLPPQENRLDLAVKAGEKGYHHD